MIVTKAPDSLHQLVDKFQRGRSAFLQPDYNETQLRQEFVNPFFEALGWDVGNSRQVLHEASLRSGRSVRHPDYSFLAGARRVFYVETKKPAIDIGENIEPAQQLRSYGWSGNTAVGILTNFAELAVYDCRIQPQQGDSPDTARLLHLDCGQYLDEWALLHSAFSREAAQQGRHRELLDEAPKNVLPVDEAFLQDMERWRRDLARELHKQGHFIDRELSERELNLLVQQTIDRIVFLRIAEDRSLEPEDQLERAAQGQGVYKKLKDLYIGADRKYNSGLFHFAAGDSRRPKPDRLSMEIFIPDSVLRPIILDLYPPKSRYQFSVIAADILGQAYERFLGNVIEVRSGKYETTVAVREKPEVRKAGGVYYTPSYIVDYIVENTVGALLEGASPEGAAQVRILDPACGSGSFLTGAYQFLLDWHLRQYARQPERYKNRISRRGDGYILNLVEKRRILTNNIYGVDLDQNAVEVSKLSLLLKMLEHEDEATGGLDANGPLLPDLGGNIKWGNSLVGSDFYDGADVGDLADEELQRVKAFDWDSGAGFGEIMAAGGFDAVIGNPPYVRQETLGREFKAYAKTKYETYAGTADLYTYFIERGVKLLKAGGLFGIIVANKWLRARYGKPLRQWLKKQAIREIVDFGDLPVFQQATTYPCILTIQAPSPHPPAPSPKMREGENAAAYPQAPKMREGENAAYPQAPKMREGENVAYLQAPKMREGENAAYLQAPKMREGESARAKWDIPPELERRMQAIARELRKNPTVAEDKLWQAIRRRQLDERKFRRQVAIGAFVVDFYCSSERLAVEVDGPIHENQREADQIRQELIESLGIRFVRLTNAEVEHNLEASLNAIRQMFTDEPAKDDEKPLPLDGGGVWGGGEKTFAAAQVDTLEFASLREHVGSLRYAVDRTMLDDGGWSLAREEVQRLADKLFSIGESLNDFVGGRMYRGVVTGKNSAFVIDIDTRNRLIEEDESSAEVIKPFLLGRDVRRYEVPTSESYLIFTRRGIDIEQYPAIKAHLKQYRQELEPRPPNWSGVWHGRKAGKYAWYEIQDTIDYHEEFASAKIVLPSIIKSAAYQLDTVGHFSNDKTTIIVSKSKYLLGLLNSKVLDFCMHQIASTKQGGYFEYKPMYLAQLPIRVIDFDNPTDVDLHDRMVALVDDLLELHRQLVGASDVQRGVIEALIARRERSVDEVVYELYGLSEEEVGVVEGG